jgi:nitrite reductase (NO-forming)
MSLSRLPFALLIPGLALLLACAPGRPAATQPASAPTSSSIAAAQQVQVSGTDSLKFEPSTLTVAAGEPVQLTFTNAGQALHDWSLPPGASSQAVKVEARAGQSATTTFSVDRPGTYTFICSQPGHEAAGMRGTLVVQ